MPIEQPEKLSAQIKLITAVVIWGGSFVATKIALQEVSPITVVSLRFLIGLLILGWIAWRTQDLVIPSFKIGLQLFGLGFIGIAFHQWLQSTGLVTSQASTTAWIVATIPIFMALLGWLFLGEKIGGFALVGIFIAALGVLLVVSKGDLSTIWQSGFGSPGDLLILISAPNWAVFSVVSRPFLQRFSAIKFTFYIMLFGSMIILIPFMGGGYWHEISHFTFRGWMSICFLGVFCSALAYIFYNDGLQALPASQAGAFIYLEPLVTTMIAVALLSEQVTVFSALGGLLILIGVWLVNRGE
jgi:drug/metabolite transporter (DMT)-like permease